MKFGFDWPSGFGERSLKMVDEHRTDNGPWLYYKLINEPKGSGEPINTYLNKENALKCVRCQWKYNFIVN